MSGKVRHALNQAQGRRKGRASCHACGAVIEALAECFRCALCKLRFCLKCSRALTGKNSDSSTLKKTLEKSGKGLCSGGNAGGGHRQVRALGGSALRLGRSGWRTLEKVGHAGGKTGPEKNPKKKEKVKLSRAHAGLSQNLQHRQIKYEDLEFLELLAQPAKAAVEKEPVDIWRGLWNGDDCFIKRLPGQSDEARTAMLREAAQLAQVPNHRCIMTFYGVSYDGPFSCMVFEATGSKPPTPLRRAFEISMVGDEWSGFPDHGFSDRQLTMVDALSVLKCVASGVAFMHSHRVLHLNLLWNAIVVDDAQPIAARLRAFYRSVSLPEDEDVVPIPAGLSEFPHRWADPEIWTHGCYQRENDVYTFGVLMWCLLAREATPWAKLSDDEVQRRVLAGDRLPKPRLVASKKGAKKGASARISHKPAFGLWGSSLLPRNLRDDLYRLCVRCWDRDFKKRPTFRILREELAELMAALQRRMQASGAGTPRQSTEAELDSRWRIPLDDVHFGRTLGAGAFGVVQQGRFKGNDCVIKTSKEGDGVTDEHIEEVLQEAVTLSRLRPHASICAFFGVVLDPRRPPCLVLEYIKGGDLLSVLRDRSKVLSGTDIVTMAKDLAAGIVVLHDNGQLHLDLAPRNLLVVGHDPLRLRITDFGLSKTLPRGEHSISAEGTMLPYRWLDPDVIRLRRFSKCSDVWSWGVCVWEMVSREQPYSEFTSSKDVIHYVLGGGVLKKPTNLASRNVFASAAAVDVLYSMMEVSWHRGDPDDHHIDSKFSHVLDGLHALLQKGDSTLNVSEMTSSSFSDESDGENISTPPYVADMGSVYQRMLEDRGRDEYETLGNEETCDASPRQGDTQTSSGQESQDAESGLARKLAVSQYSSPLASPRVPPQSLSPLASPRMPGSQYSSHLSSPRISGLSIEGLQQLLAERGVTQASLDLLVKNNIDGSVVSELSKEILLEMGITSIGDRLKLLKLQKETNDEP